MTRPFRALFRSLEIRLLVPLSITVGLVLAVHAFLSFRSTQTHFLQLAHAEIERSSGLIQKATHDGMLLNRLDDVQATIERLAEQDDIAAIRVYDKQGTIVLSAHKNELGESLPMESDVCRSCHEDGQAGNELTPEQCCLTDVPGGIDVPRHLVVIANDSECAVGPCHFHPPDQRVLGVLDVEMSMAPLEAAISTSRNQLASTTIALILIIGFIAAVFVRRVIHRPAQLLFEGTQRIAAGDLDTRIEVRGDHELARLAVAFNRMVEELGNARREVTEWSQKLEDKVAAKREELKRAQHQVLHMEKMSSLGKLSATVAHEINNPISGMLTYARLVKRELAEQPLDPVVREELDRYLSLMDKECTRCGAIVHNLLTFARRTGGEMTTVDLNDLVERSLMLIRHHLEISNVRLRSELLADNKEIEVDAGQIQQALVALLVNAVEAMSEVANGQAELSVRLQGNAEFVQIEVSDVGVGIEPSDLPHIFEPFFSTKGEEESGVGLGLAVVYGIVNRHRGNVDVESEPGRGTTFRIRLPRYRSGQKEVRPAAMGRLGS